jgi:hypothetical protein
VIWRVAFAVLVACGGNQQDVGGQCERDKDCASGICVTSRCQSGAHGSPCFQDRQCVEYGDTCVLGTCNDPAARAKWAEERRAIEQRERDAQAAKKEADMLAASGVQPTAEAAPRAAAAGPRVRTATVTGKQEVFAACRSDERLVGGGCKSDYLLANSYPSETSTDDTVGARWNCKANSRDDITAYALCAKVSP